MSDMTDIMVLRKQIEYLKVHILRLEKRLIDMDHACHPLARHRERVDANMVHGQGRQCIGPSTWGAPRQKALELKAGPSIDFNAIGCGSEITGLYKDFHQEPEPSAGLGPEIKHCECGAQRGQLHFQYCPMWEETHATETD